jgi:hypothetical protein
MKLGFLKKQTIRNDAGEAYLVRRAINTPLGGIKLHHILRSDEDRDCHDHPWSFLSIILAGGYFEHRPDIRQGWVGGHGVLPGTGCEHCRHGMYRYVNRHGVPFHTASRFGPWAGPYVRVPCPVRVAETVRTWHGPLSILWRPAPSVHRLELLEGKTAWSLVFTGPKRREWGFHTVCGFIPWFRYWDAKAEGC